MQRAALGQAAVGDAPAVFLLAAVGERTTAKYGPERGARFVQMEAGHAAQNLLLQAVALGLGAVPVGAFDEAALSRALDLPAGEAPLYLIPVGHPAP
jgi:SagB-type dehydrogenase family enzyme